MYTYGMYTYGMYTYGMYTYGMYLEVHKLYAFSLETHKPNYKLATLLWTFFACFCSVWQNHFYKPLLLKIQFFALFIEFDKLLLQSINQNQFHQGTHKVYLLQKIICIVIQSLNVLKYTCTMDYCYFTKLCLQQLFDWPKHPMCLGQDGSLSKQPLLQQRPFLYLPWKYDSKDAKD